MATCHAARFARSCTGHMRFLPTHMYPRGCLPDTQGPPPNAPPPTKHVSWGVGKMRSRVAATKFHRISDVKIVKMKCRVMRASGLAELRTKRSNPQTDVALMDRRPMPITRPLRWVSLARNPDAVDRRPRVAGRIPIAGMPSTCTSCAHCVVLCVGPWSAVATPELAPAVALCWIAGLPILSALIEL